MAVKAVVLHGYFYTHSLRNILYSVVCADAVAN